MWMVQAVPKMVMVVGLMAMVPSVRLLLMVMMMVTMMMSGLPMMKIHCI